MTRIVAIAALVAVFVSMYVVAAVLVAILLFALRVPPPPLTISQALILVAVVIGDLAFRGPQDAAALVVFVAACGLMAALRRRRTSAERATP